MQRLRRQLSVHALYPPHHSRSSRLVRVPANQFIEGRRGPPSRRQSGKERDGVPTDQLRKRYRVPGVILRAPGPLRPRNGAGGVGSGIVHAEGGEGECGGYVDGLDEREAVQEGDIVHRVADAVAVDHKQVLGVVVADRVRGAVVAGGREEAGGVGLVGAGRPAERQGYKAEVALVWRGAAVGCEDEVAGFGFGIEGG